MKNQKHLNLLTKEETHILYSLPNFTAVERNHYFSLPNPIVRQLKFRDLNGNKTSTKLYFILQFGYFKAKNLFFVFKYKDVIEDVTFIMQNYLPNDHLPKNLPTKKQRAKVKRNLLIYFGFQNNVKDTHALILKKTIALAKSTIEPYAICVDIVKLLREEKIVLPSYCRLQDTIGAGLKKEEARLIRMTKKYLSKKIQLAISTLFQIEDVFYKITELKFDAKCFRTQEMKAEIEKLAICILIFNFSKTFLPKTQISRKNIEYYADLVKLYTVNRLQKIPSGLSSFYLICYVNQRCEHILNNLVKGFIYYVDKYISSAEKHANDNLLVIQSDLEKHKDPIGRLIKLYTDDELMKLTGKKIRAEAFKIMPKENILKISKSLLNTTTTRKELKTKLMWEYHKENYRSILINLRPLFLAIDFTSHKELNDVLKAITFLKIHFTEDKNLHSLTMNNCPTQHINPIKLLDYFVESKNHKTKKQGINIYQYEFYVYKAIRDNFRKHRIFANDSIEYKDFNVDIKKQPDWEKIKTKY